MMSAPRAMRPGVSLVSWLSTLSDEEFNHVLSYFTPVKLITLAATDKRILRLVTVRLKSPRPASSAFTVACVTLWTSIFARR